MKPQQVTKLDLAFPGSVSHLMPRYDEIPKEFKKDNNPWVKFVDQWFFGGANAQALMAKKGIERHMALDHLRVIMGSFEPKHEHKISAVAYLLSQWFDFAESNK